MAKRPPPEPEGALYVRLPADAIARLDRASEALRMPKKDLVAGLVTRYVDPDSRRGLTALGALSPPRRSSVEVGGPTPTVGAYSFQPYDPPAARPESVAVPEPALEVMTAEQTAQLLQLDAKLVVELAEAGDLPGRKLGSVWRFSRTAILAWLAAP